ncbi:MAG: response regulator transcription factor [Chloroflexi bacterium]|nr:response regulator transcription factor [Chloroflexota bacterium]
MKRNSILVVDDDPHYVKLVRVNLELSGYRVLAARDGFDAISTVETRQPDLLILDVMMPGLDGYEVCRRVREFSLVPIIMLTARGEQAHKVQGLRCGADDYVTKPFGAEELVARVEAVLRRSTSQRDEPRQASFTCGELTVNFVHHTLSVGGRRVDLTATEFKVLRQLIENAGFVVSQEEILSKVWGPQYRGDRELLKVCISRLRKKIEEDPHRPRYLQTKRGIGYNFTAPRN